MKLDYGSNFLATVCFERNAKRTYFAGLWNGKYGTIRADKAIKYREIGQLDLLQLG